VKTESLAQGPVEDSPDFASVERCPHSEGLIACGTRCTYEDEGHLIRVFAEIAGGIKTEQASVQA